MEVDLGDAFNLGLIHLHVVCITSIYSYYSGIGMASRNTVYL